MKNILSLCGIILFASMGVKAQSTRSQTSSGGGSSSSSGSVRSGVLFDIATYYGTVEETSKSTVQVDTKTNESVYDMKLGYVFPFGLYAGAEYSVRNSGFINWSTTGNGTALGVGYVFRNGLYVRGYYRFNEVYSDYRGGTGYQLDAGYSQMFATNFYLGFSLSRRDVTFDKRDSDANLKSYNYQATYPMLTVGFLIN
jgi:hypothetical protein